MDTDVEVLKPLDGFLQYNAFSGFEAADIIQPGLMGSEKGGVWVKQELDYYKDKHFLNPDGTPDLTPNTKTITEHLVSDGFILNNSFQNHKDIVTMYPNDFFSPKSWKTQKVNLTSNTHTIHHFDGSWIPKSKKFLTALYVLMSRIFGEKFADAIARILKP